MYCSCNGSYGIRKRQVSSEGKYPFRNLEWRLGLLLYSGLDSNRPLPYPPKYFVIILATYLVHSVVYKLIYDLFL
jgi:hypothetical protein